MPSANSQITQAEQRAWSYWFADGLPHIVAGLSCTLLACIFVLLANHGRSRSPALIAAVALATAVCIVIFARFSQTVGWLKTRITYPRTGYAAPPYFTETSAAPADLVMLNLSGVREKETTTPLLIREDLQWRLWVMLAILLAEPLVGKFIISHLACAAAGCAGGFLGWLVSRKDPRKSWAVVFGLLFAQVYMVNFLSQRQVVEGAGYFQGGVGFVLTLAGVIILVRYLRLNPAKQA